MPKLSKTVAKRADAAEVADYTAFAAGPYVLKLRKVSADRNGEPLVGRESGVPYWSWEFEVVSPEEALSGDGKRKIKTKGRRLWTNISLGEDSDWKLKEAFQAFGVPLDTDTDELIGNLVKATVTVSPQTQGANKGELQNQISKLMPHEGGESDESDEGWDTEEGTEGEDDTPGEGTPTAEDDEEPF